MKKIILILILIFGFSCCKEQNSEKLQSQSQDTTKTEKKSKYWTKEEAEQHDANPYGF